MATAVLTGALLVGDSVRGSLRSLSLDRLGKIDSLMIANRFFRTDLATDLNSVSDFKRKYDEALPAIIFGRGTVERRSTDKTNRASQVLIVGCDERFWDLGSQGIRPNQHPGPGQILFNRALAEELIGEGADTEPRVAATEEQVRGLIGDDAVLRLPELKAIPAESPLGDKEDRVRGIPGLEVVDVVPDKGLGRFSLTASQSRPLVAFVAIKTIQDALRQPGKVNAILVATGDPGYVSNSEDCLQLQRWLTPTLEDYGLAFHRVRMLFDDEASATDETIYDYLSLVSDRMVIEQDAEQAVASVLEAEEAVPLLTYLANGIGRPDTSDRDDAIPYSTVTAIPSISDLGSVVDMEGNPVGVLDNSDIVLNEWAAADQNLKIGDAVRLAYFQPETTDGEPVEVHADFRVKAILPLTEPDQPFRRNRPAKYSRRPTIINDNHLTPEVKGITDQDSMDDWDVPFPLTRQIRQKDDEYYENHRLTPKAFISLEAGQELWGSRFGRLTSFRVPLSSVADRSEDENSTLDSRVADLEKKLVEQIQADPNNLGLSFSPIKQDAMNASRGTTPFDVLFLMLSLFVIAAALMLVSLLFRLSVERRAGQVGLLLALGLRRKQVAWTLVGEAAIVAGCGAALGILVGVLYARLMIAGLTTVWIGAITTPFLRFAWSPTSLVVGFVIGMVVCLVTIAWSVRQLRRIPETQLLAGRGTELSYVVGRRLRTNWLPAALVTLAVCMGAAAPWLSGEAQAGCFVGAGAMTLAAVLITWRDRLRGAQRRNGDNPSLSLSLSRLAASSARRNPARSTLTIALIAVATFLIISMSSFRMAPTESGTGGFNLLAESSQPILLQLNKPEAREELLASEASLLEGTSILSLRVQPGDDASCTNLYKANRPRVLGVSPGMVRHFQGHPEQGFAWAGTAATTPEEKANPWLLLEKPTSPDAPVPVVLDKNTAMYGLGKYGGVGQTFSFEYPGAQTVDFEVVGLLSNSVLQGNLLIGDRQFTRLFPDRSGYQFFLLQTPLEQAVEIRDLLEETLGDEGFDARDAQVVLSSLLAVQNTYLSTFQSLGALGLLLGTFGVVTVQMRNVFERRAELALLRATGFRTSQLGQLVFLENLFLLFGGVAVGLFSALVAVVPHMLLGDASVPWLALSIMLVVICVVGLATGLVSVRAVVRTPVLAALRAE